jgi:hypothetical protein
VYVFKFGNTQQLLFKAVPYCLIFGPVGSHKRSAGLNAPFNFLGSYATGCLSIAHLAGQIAKIAKINVYVHWVRKGVPRFIKMSAARALIKAVVERLAKNYTFLIAVESATIATKTFVSVASTTLTKFVIF